MIQYTRCGIQHMQLKMKIGENTEKSSQEDLVNLLLKLRMINITFEKICRIIHSNELTTFIDKAYV